VVLVHEDAVDVASMAAELWYPLWDDGARVDHSVRSLSEMATATGDLRTALGLLDIRHLAGDPSLTLRVRASVLAQWRREARSRLPELRQLVASRSARVGELAHSSVPDLKEAGGGLRDATVLKALVATWLVDVPHTEVERCRRRLLDVRDALHRAAGRPGDRIAPEIWSDLAGELGVEADEAQRLVRESGRRVTHISRLTWSRVDAALRPRAPGSARGPILEKVARGIAVSAGEVVLARDAHPTRDPHLLLRAAAEAAERGLVLAPATAARAARECPPLPEPWDGEARDLFVRLLAAGPGLLPAWETLDETGGLLRVLPEWERVRLLPHASVVHRFTVDRHLVETCMELSTLLRRVSRPDLAVVAALLHDIGKGGEHDHSVAGEKLAALVAQRMGFDPREVAHVARLVRWHLLLVETATTRDLEDRGTIAFVADRVLDVETLDLLEVLTEADARATAAKAWSPWRSRLVHDLVGRVRGELSVRGGAPAPPAAANSPEVTIPAAVPDDLSLVDITVIDDEDGAQITICAVDRVGLLAATAAMLASFRVDVRSARAWTQDKFALSTWEVSETGLDPALLRQRLEAVLHGDGALREPRRTGTVSLEPAVLIRAEASSREASVLEVRDDDWPGVVACVCAALARLDLSVRSAHVATVGPQAVDVFYIQEPGAGAPTDERCATAVHAVRRALADPDTLDA